MTEIKLTLDDAGMAAQQLRHAANHWNDGAPKPNPVGDLLLSLADSIEEQVKPAVEEPVDFGSVVKVKYWNGRGEVRWCRTYSVLVDEPWCTGNHMGSWAEVVEEASDVEVLRVGIGDEPGWGYRQGQRDFAASLLTDLIQLQSSAITAPEKRCFESARATVAALLGES